MVWGLGGGGVGEYFRLPVINAFDKGIADPHRIHGGLQAAVMYLDSLSYEDGWGKLEAGSGKSTLSTQNLITWANKFVPLGTDNVTDVNALSAAITGAIIGGALAPDTEIKNVVATAVTHFFDDTFVGDFSPVLGQVTGVLVSSALKFAFVTNPIAYVATALLGLGLTKLSGSIADFTEDQSADQQDAIKNINQLKPISDEVERRAYFDWEHRTVAFDIYKNGKVGLINGGIYAEMQPHDNSLTYSMADKTIIKGPSGGVLFVHDADGYNFSLKLDQNDQVIIDPSTGRTQIVKGVINSDGSLNSLGDTLTFMNDGRWTQTSFDSVTQKVVTKTGVITDGALKQEEWKGSLTKTLIDGTVVEFSYETSLDGSVRIDAIQSINGNELNFNSDSHYRTLLNELNLTPKELVDGLAKPNLTAFEKSISSTYTKLKEWDRDYGSAVQKTEDFLSIVQAIQTGKPLPIIKSTLNLVNNSITSAVVDGAKISSDTVNGIQGATAIVGAVGSILNLKNR